MVNLRQCATREHDGVSLRYVTTNEREKAVMPVTQQVELPYSTPEAQGVSSTAIEAFLQAAEREILHLHSFMLLRHGHVVAEGYWQPHDAQTPHMLFSLSKSFTSTAIGLLVADGKLTVNDRVVSFFPDEAPAKAENCLDAMRVRHLLSMSTGHDTDPTRAVFSASNWARAFFAQPVMHEPGTHFVYNTAATYMLSAIIQKITGMRMLHFLQPRLFEPLGIDNPTWDTSPQGIDVGGSGLSITPRDIARFGQLYLQKGTWQGSQLIPEAWVEEATRYHVPNGPSENIDWAQGYGYQFWRCRHNAYRGDGAFGQFCVVMPDQDSVFVTTSGVSGMQRILDLVYEHLLPAMGTAPLPDDPSTSRALTESLGHLRLPPVDGKRSSTVAAQVDGKSFAIEDNEDTIHALKVNFHPEGAILTFINKDGEQCISCGYGAWAMGTAAIERTAMGRGIHTTIPVRKVAASGAWTGEQTYTARLWWYETPFSRTITLRFDGDHVVAEQHMNLAMGPTERPTLRGTAT